MAKARIEFVPRGFQRVLARAAPVVEAQARGLAAKVPGASSRAVTLTRFRGGPRPGAVVTAEGPDGRSALEKAL